MKKLILALILCTSFSSYATQYCYDEAVFAVMKMERDVKACDENLSTKPLKRLIRKLQRVHPGYSLKIRNAMSKLYGYMHTDLAYKYAETEDVQKCVKKLEYNKFDNLKIEVMDAMVLCGL